MQAVKNIKHSSIYGEISLNCSSCPGSSIFKSKVNMIEFNNQNEKGQILQILVKFLFLCHHQKSKIK